MNLTSLLSLCRRAGGSLKASGREAPNFYTIKEPNPEWYLLSSCSFRSKEPPAWIVGGWG